jgi:hypothetical protein
MIADGLYSKKHLETFCIRFEGAKSALVTIIPPKGLKYS